ncbi:MAG TPA: tyrosine--tRNA ligase [Anaerolineae bacterium]|nr:tyrosine--tRNA ligase [Anaerolineae bacterium]
MKIEEQVALFMQGTQYGDVKVKNAMAQELNERLNQAQKKREPLRVYCGYDPTRSDLHIGHTVTMRKLRQFQELGHDVTFLIGDFTALIGDPSDKDVTRPILTHEQVERNARTYAEQAFRILDPKKTTIRHNSEWLSKINYADLIKLASNFTVQQFLSREKFKLRWEKGDAIYLHETFYAVMQGYDAYMLKADVQVGGTDQFFNIMTASRKIMSALGSKPNIAICLPILPGTDGKEKMSQSLGNYISLSTTAEDMFGKLMSIPDKAMPQYFRLVTRWAPSEIKEIEKALTDSTMNPRDAKIKLAFEVTEAFYGNEKAKNAERDFIQRFRERKIPGDLEICTFEPGEKILDTLINSDIVKSRSEGKRLIQQRGVRLNDRIIEDWRSDTEVGILQVGKRRIIKLDRK